MKNKRAFWEFIGDNFVALSTVFGGILVLVWQMVINPSNIDPVLAAILGLLVLLATSEMVESRKRLDKIQKTLDEDVAKILAALPLAEIKRFTDSASGIEYLCKRMEETQRSMDLAAIDLRVRTSASREREMFVQARLQVIRKGVVRFRYLFRPNPERTKGVADLLTKAVPGKFFVGGLPYKVDNLPLPVVYVFDNDEVCTRSPYELGEDEVYISIKHPDVVKYFSHWFEKLWEKSVKIDPNMPYEQQVHLLEQLERAN